MIVLICVLLVAAAFWAYFMGKEVGREESDIDRYCAQVDQDLDDEMRRRRLGET